MSALPHTDLDPPDLPVPRWLYRTTVCTAELAAANLSKQQRFSTTGDASQGQLCSRRSKQVADDDMHL